MARCLIIICANSLFMDRKITRIERLKLNRKRIIVSSCVLILLIGAGIYVWKGIAPSVRESELGFAVVDTGDIEISVGGHGRVVPAMEEIINSPVSTRILEVYRHAGDRVEAGTPLMRLDLEATRIDLEKQRDALAMMKLALEKLQVANNTRIRDLEMKIQVAEMQLHRLDMQLSNERYLDSIGGGTTDKVREVEFARRSGALELDQLRQQLSNERRTMQADVRIKQLEIEVKGKDLSLTSRMLDDAEIRSPRSATVTSIVNEIGAQITAGQRVASIADLGHFRIDGEVPDSYGRDVAAGCRVTVKIARQNMSGTIATVSPTSKSGMYSFTVALDCDSASVLRPGVKVELYISNGLRTDVRRIPNASFYNGPGVYQLFVDNGAGVLEARDIKLGAAGFDYVEVESGLNVGERVVISNEKLLEGQQRVVLKK